MFSWSDIASFTPDLLGGAKLSVILTFVTMTISILAGLLVALCRLSPWRPLYLLARAYIEIIRGTPALVQIFYIFYALPSLGVVFNPFVAGVLGLSINYTAYLAEVYRGGIQSIPRTQSEAALALGMTNTEAMRFVVLPQVVRVILPPMANYLLSMFKDTSLLSVITIQELMFTGQLIAARTFKYFESFTLVAVIYLAMCYPSSLLISRLEGVLKTRRRRRPTSGINLRVMGSRGPE